MTGSMPRNDTDRDRLGTRILLSARVVYGAMLFGLILFGAAVYALGRAREATLAVEQEQLLFYVVVGMTVATAMTAPLISAALFRGRMANLPRGGVQRAQAYLGWKIVTAALIEAPALLWLILSLIAAKSTYLFGAGTCFIFLLLQFPTDLDFDAKTELRSNDD